MPRCTAHQVSKRKHPEAQRKLGMNEEIRIDHEAQRAFNKIWNEFSSSKVASQRFGVFIDQIAKKNNYPQDYDFKDLFKKSFDSGLNQVLEILSQRNLFIEIIAAFKKFNYQDMSNSNLRLGKEVIGMIIDAKVPIVITNDAVSFKESGRRYEHIVFDSASKPGGNHGTVTSLDVARQYNVSSENNIESNGSSAVVLINPLAIEYPQELAHESFAWILVRDRQRELKNAGKNYDAISAKYEGGLRWRLSSVLPIFDFLVMRFDLLDDLKILIEKNSKGKLND